MCQAAAVIEADAAPAAAAPAADAAPAVEAAPVAAAPVAPGKPHRAVLFTPIPRPEEALQASSCTIL